MEIAFFSTKPYDKVWFEPMGKEYGFEIRFYEMRAIAAVTLENVYALENGLPLVNKTGSKAVK